MSLGKKILFALVALFVLTVPVALQAEAGYPYQHIQDRLQETFQYDSSEPMPLGEALGVLQKEIGVAMVVVDKRVLDAAGVTLDKPVTLRLPVRMPLKETLNYVAKQCNLSYAIQDEVIQFGYQNNRMYFRHYYVGDIVQRDIDPAVLQKLSKDEKSSLEFQPIIDYIQTMVKPESWGENSIMVYYPNLCLVIKQTESVHEEIVTLLRDLRRYNDVQIQFTIETLSGPFIDGVTKNGRWTMFDGQSMTIDPMNEERTIQLTPISAKPVNEHVAAMNHPLVLKVPAQSKVSVKGTVGQKDGAEAIKLSVSIDDQVLESRTFYGFPLRPAEMAKSMLGAK